MKTLVTFLFILLFCFEACAQGDHNPSFRYDDKEIQKDIKTYNEEVEKCYQNFRKEAQAAETTSRMLGSVYNAVSCYMDIAHEIIDKYYSENAAEHTPSLGDGRVFDRQQPNTLGDLVVDILLDASASQNRRQEQLATQGYILAEALTRCAIPVRVLSYCSVSGCTVLREYRDYRENQGNNRIFEFAAAGWNRDGLALRAVDWLLRRSGEQQRLLLILTDANPNDDTRLPGTGNQFFSRDYSGRPAVADAAEEATALRRHGNPPLCLFSGREGDLSSARTIYGRDVVRLPSVGWFAQTVGKIIQGRLQALES